MIVNNICPFCGRFIDTSEETEEDICFTYQGKGTFKNKQFFHKLCFEENSRGEKP